MWRNQPVPSQVRGERLQPVEPEGDGELHLAGGGDAGEDREARLAGMPRTMRGIESGRDEVARAGVAGDGHLLGA